PPYRILIAEDVPENRRLLTTLLESIGFEVKAVENGADAITQGQTWHPDLIFMDIQMPIMDGYQATQQIRLEESHLRNQQSGRESHPPTPTKIIALTAYAFDDDRLTSLDAGCDDYISKPFTEANLLDKVARHLGVHYSYGEKAPSKPTSGLKKLTPQDLTTMPQAWIVQVHNAALDLNDGRLLQLIAQIPPEQQSLIDALKLLVDNFQLESIATLTASGT
ncbi:MAG: response regulator, partial [Leptolyngbyaceae cyanobacterium bins.59]|nr:response regulator [Leptolyngbyaceae cyanobacterium bins.59]